MERDYVLLGILSLSAVLHFVSIVLGVLSYTITGAPFQNLSPTLTEKYATQFSPETWIYIFWNSILWIWTTLIFVYLGVNVFRENKDGKMYCNPPLVTREIAGLMSVSAVLHVVWLFVWDMEELAATVVVLFFLMASSWATAAIFTFRFWKATPFLFHHTRLDLWIFRILVQNGLGAYATWVTLEFLIKLSAALSLSYESEAVDGYPTPSIIAIIILNFVLAILFPFEMISWEKAVRYLISPITVVLWVMASTYVRLLSVQYYDETVEVYALVMLVISTVLWLGRCANMVIRHFRNPLVPYV